MVDKSSLVIILVSTFIILLTFRDLVRQTNSESSPRDQEESDDEFNLNKMDDFEEKTSEMEMGENFDDAEGDDDNVNVKKIPSLKLMKTLNQQTLKFLFCYSCGYRNMFEQYSQLIQSKFPDIKIVGENYPPPQYKIYITQFISTFKLLIIGAILFGQNPFPYLNMETPQAYTWATNNKLYSCMMIFFLTNTIESSLISTGAFEIYLNDVKIWSKIETERIPHEKELMQLLDMNFNFETQKKAAFGDTSNF